MDWNPVWRQRCRSTVDSDSCGPGIRTRGPRNSRCDRWGAVECTAAKRARRKPSPEEGGDETGCNLQHELEARTRDSPAASLGTKGRGRAQGPSEVSGGHWTPGGAAVHGTHSRDTRQECSCGMPRGRGGGHCLLHNLGGNKIGRVKQCPGNRALAFWWLLLGIFNILLSPPPCPLCKQRDINLKT